MAFNNVSFQFSLITLFYLIATTQSAARFHVPRTNAAAQLQITSPMIEPNAPQTAPSPSPSQSTSVTVDAPGGEWVLLQKSVGVSAMHMQLLYDNKVLIFDRTDFGTSNLSLPAGVCRTNDAVVKLDCSAHSLLYDVATNTYRPLLVQTNVWCSSGSLHPDGTLVQTGGYSTGDKKIRLFKPCNGSQCDWIQLPEDLTVRRWYASNQILPDGRVIVVGGRRQFNYEFFPKSKINRLQTRLYNLPFLNVTTDRFEENNLYPFLHLLPDGNLFIFANMRSILLDYVNNRVIREYPQIPGEKRNYPSAGSSVLLPLRGQQPAAEVLICGGAPYHAYFKADNLSIFVEASKTCGRMKLTDPNPQWVMENMPMSRVMSDMILLPTGDVLIINGASNGTAGWEDAVGPVLNPLLYSPTKPDPSQRFSVLNPTTIPRMYHSSAILLADGRILVGGSNPHVKYDFMAKSFPTDLSLEAFLPPYMAPQNSDLRPSIFTVDVTDKLITYSQQFSIMFTVRTHRPDQEITVAMIAPAFTTHSTSMNQRMVYLDVVGGVQQLSEFGYKVNVLAPPTRNIAPPGYYMLFLVHGGIPGESVWIKINN